MAIFRCFVRPHSEPNPKGDLIHSVRIQFEIGWRVINRISAEDDKHLYKASVDIGDQIAELVDLAFFRKSGERICIDHRLTDISERSVHQVGKGMYNG